MFYDIGTRKGFTINLDFKDKPKNEKTIHIKYEDLSNVSDIGVIVYIEPQQNQATNLLQIDLVNYVV